mmetsp:Transcript_7993/g.17114  ORF Transcript_7993/g.17114 Transcript_7993/m.17114 type:complete len:248 (+) Transcript_7993:936-1679(+)
MGSLAHDDESLLHPPPQHDLRRRRRVLPRQPAEQRVGEAPARPVKRLGRAHQHVPQLEVLDVPRPVHEGRHLELVHRRFDRRASREKLLVFGGREVANPEVSQLPLLTDQLELLVRLDETPWDRPVDEEQVEVPSEVQLLHAPQDALADGGPIFLIFVPDLRHQEEVLAGQAGPPQGPAERPLVSVVRRRVEVTVARLHGVSNDPLSLLVGRDLVEAEGELRNGRPGGRPQTRIGRHQCSLLESPPA